MRSKETRSWWAIGAGLVASWGCGPVGSGEFGWTSVGEASGADSTTSDGPDGGSTDAGTGTDSGDSSEGGGTTSGDPADSSDAASAETSSAGEASSDGESGGDTPCSPAPEACDNVDNDCDGAIDEADPNVGLDCSTGSLGVCGPGTFVCAAGSLVCRSIDIATVDLCDGLDNDCDGTLDEGDPSLGLGCGTGQLGACSAGTLACGQQGLVCQGLTFASSEVCDGIDNDCNGLTDEHALDVFVAYQAFDQQSSTGLHETNDAWSFEIAANDDIVAVNREGGTGTTEVHVLSAASGYQSFSLHASTALPAVGGSWVFALAPNRDLFAISRAGTGTGTTEVHVLTAASDYQTFSVHTGTAMPETNDDFEFFVASNRDVVIVKKRFTGTAATEVHVLSAASGYQQFALNVATGLEEVDDSWVFGLGPNRDLFAIRRRGTGTCSTEVHVMTAASNYAAFELRTGTALGEVDDTFDFEVGPNRRVFGLKKSSTGTGSTEIHLLRP